MDWKWFVENPARLRRTVVSALAVLPLLLAISFSTRLASSGSEQEAAPASTPSASTTPSVQDTRLIPPSPEVTDQATPAQDFGDAAPIMVEAVRAWLSGDLAAFSRLASPEMTELVADGQPARPGQKILSAPQLDQPGPTQQSFRIQVTDGWLDVVMAVDQTLAPPRWVVDDMRFER